MRLASLLIVLLSAHRAIAHDFWIEPSTFRPGAGEMFTASLRVGQEFVGDPIPRSARLIDTFIVRDAGGERAVGGFENQDPAGYVRVENPGLAIIGYRSKPYPLELSAEKFEEFLKLEGLERISALRAARGESKKPDRERFYRFAKSMIVTGSGGGRFDRPLGHRFEIVPETNPMASGPLRVLLLLEGKPQAGALVMAVHRDDPAARSAVRTDAKGRATLALPKPGVWLIKSVALVPAPAGTNVDWESLWASLTFER